MRLLSIQSYGNYDTHRELLNDALRTDPTWPWGWSDVAFLLLRSASLDRNQDYIEQAREILASKADHGGGKIYCQIVRCWLATYWDRDLDQAETLARPLAEQGRGWPYAMILLSSGLLREAEAYFQHLTKHHPYESLGWEMLIESRLNLGDATGAVNAARSLVRLYPPDALNALTLLAWPLVFAGELDESAELLAKADQLQDSMGDGTQKRLSSKSLERVRFEQALCNGDIEAATLAVQRCHRRETLNTRSPKIVAALKAQNGFRKS